MGGGGGVNDIQNEIWQLNDLLKEIDSFSLRRVDVD